MQTNAEQQETAAEDQGERAFFYSLADIPARTAEEMLAGLPPEEQEYRFGLFGRDLVTKVIVRSPKLCVFHETAPAGARVKPHRHGTHQLTYVLQGELMYGNRHVSAGMGYFTPDTLYSWTTGPEGAEWLEVHSGTPGLFTDRPDHQD